MIALWLVQLAVMRLMSMEFSLIATTAFATGAWSSAVAAGVVFAVCALWR